MARPDTQDGQGNGTPGNVAGVESRLRHLFAEQRRLREVLERARAELNQVNREVLKVQEDFCTDQAREEEYRRCLQRILGFDPYITPQEIEDAIAHGPTPSELVEEVERIVRQASSSGTK